MAPTTIYRNPENRAAATRWLAWRMAGKGKTPKEITSDDFEDNGLSGLLATHYNYSPHLALVEAGYAYSEEEALEHALTMRFDAEKIYPWEMSKSPMGLYEKRENRVAAIRWLAWKMKDKEPRDIIAGDFDSNGLRGLMPYYHDSPFEALLDAGLVSREDESYMRGLHHTP
jgi:hypothetical protein